MTKRSTPSTSRPSTMYSSLTCRIALIEPWPGCGAIASQARPVRQGTVPPRMAELDQMVLRQRERRLSGELLPASGYGSKATFRCPGCADRQVWDVVQPQP